MEVWHVISSFLIAGIALYGLGIPLGWLLPAPSNAQWVQRIAVAPPLAILVTFPLAWLLWLAGIPLNPLMLVFLIVAAWLVAWRRNSGRWFAGSRPVLWVPPALMIATSGYVWFMSLRGYGLMLPNRDFKNHAYWVAQFAWDRFVDPLHTTRATPISPPAYPGLGRIGLQTLLGWALPTSEWNSLGVTAAAALLVGMVSLPLGLIVLARMWMPQSEVLWIMTGAGGVLLPIFTSPFAIGSVSLMVGTAVFPAALASLWLLVWEPTWGRLIGFLAVAAGMAVTHIPESAALGLLFVLAIPRVVPALAGPVSLRKRAIAVVLVLIALILPAVVAFTRFFGGAEGVPDIQENTASLGIALAFPIVVVVGGTGILAFTLIVLAATGCYFAVRLRLSLLPVLVIALCSFLSVGAVAAVAPEFWRALSLPWYGTVGRIALLAGAPVVLLVCLPLERISVLAAKAQGEAARVVIVGVTLLAAVAVGVGFSRFMVAERRFDLAGSLAGAGDTPEIARQLKDMLGPGETVLNLENDGTANLFAAARVPVLAGIDTIRAAPGGPMPRPLLYDTWLRLDQPQVQALLGRLNVRYFAVGTRNVYWGTSAGYALTDLLDQSELSVAMVGSDMVVLRYDPRTGSQ